MTLKGKKILIGGVIAATTAGTLTAILVPILRKSKSENEVEINDYKSLVAKIVAAENEQVAKERTMELYGLELKNDDDITSLEDDEKIPYNAAKVLGKYIFDNKDEYQISVYEGKDSNELKQLLLVFKLKATTEESASDSADWPTNKIDTTQDEFAFLHTIFKDKFVHGEFENGKLDSAPEGFATDFKTQKYKMLELFFAFKNATPSENDFSKYNSASNTDEHAKEIIKAYIVSLIDNGIMASGLDNNIEFTKDASSVADGKISGTITFNYEGYEEIKNVKFIHTNEYKLEIVSTKETKMADEVITVDVKFVGEAPTGVSIASVKVSTKTQDGSKVLVTFQAIEGTRLLTQTQELGGFTSYKQKAFETIKDMNNNDFTIIGLASKLASNYVDKITILGTIKAKIDGLSINDGILAKVKSSITTDDIILTSNDITGSLNITIKNLDDETFVVPGFLTRAQKDVNDVVILFKQSVDGIGPLKGLGAVDEGETLTTSTASTLANKENVLPKTLDGSKTVVELGFKSPSLPEGVSVSYLAVGDNGDGTITVTATILKNSVTEKVKFKLSGFLTNDQKAINEVKNLIDALEDTTKIFITTIAAIEKSSDTKFNALIYKSLGGDDTSFPKNIKDTILTYFHSGIDRDGNLTVTVQITKGSGIAQTSEFTIAVSGINTTNNADIDAVKQEIEKIAMSKTTTTVIALVTEARFDEAALKLLGTGGTFPTDIKETILTYSHNGINTDGTLAVTVTIAKGSGTQTTSFDVDVSGIVAAAQANKDIAAVKGAFDAISGMSKSTLVAITPVTKSPSVALDEAAFNLLGSGATFPDDTKDTTLTYSHNGIDSDGSLTVTVTIAKGSGTTQTAEFTVAVSGINAATQANKDIAAVKGAFDAISGMSKSTLVAIPPVTKSPSVTLDQDAFNLLGGGATFPDTKNTILTYSHEGIVNDGSLTVTVTIAKGSGETKTAKFTVAVSGIDVAQANKDIAAVKGAFDAISGMSKSTLVAIPSVTKSPSVTLDEDAFNLLGSGATFPDDTKDTTLTYSHNGIDSDGSLTVTVTIAKGSGTTQTAEFTVAVSGINAVTQANKDIAAVKGAFDAISGMSKSTLVAITPVTKSPSVALDEAAFNLLGSGATFPDDTKDTTLTYSHNGIDSDGSLTVTVTIAKGSGTTQTAEFTVAVSGIDDADIAAVKGAFDAISGMSKSTLVAIPPVTKSPSVTLGEAAFNLLGSGATFPDDTKDTTLTYSHNGIDSDGSLTVTVTIAKGSGTTQTAEFTVAVSGIDDADIAAVKGAFDAISGMSKSTLVAIPPVTKSPSVTLDEAAFNLLGSGATFPDDTKDTTLTYSHNGIDSDGSLTVTVTIAKGSGTTQTAKFTVAVSGIDVAQANKDIAAVKGAFDAISGMSKSTLVAIPPVTKSPSVTLGEAAFNLLGSGATFPDDTKDTTLTYSHNGIDSDGSLTVTVTIAKGSGTTQTAEFTVAVSGINAATQANKDIAAVKGAFDAISGMSKSTLVAIPPVTKSPSVTLGEAAFNLLGSGATFPDDTKDTTLTYSHNGIDSDGSLTVTVTIAKGSGTTQTAEFTVAVSGINAVTQANKDIAAVKGAFDAISGMSKSTLVAIPPVTKSPSVSLGEAAFNLLGSGATFPDDTKDTTLTYSHNGIDSDGSLTVTVTIAKGSGTTQTAEFTVAVSGIDDADIAAVKGAFDAISGMSKSTLVAIPPVTKSPSVTLGEAAFNLLGSGATFPDDTKDTTLTYSHNGIDSDGSLTVTVTIAKGSGTTQTAEFTVAVSGIDDADIAAVKGAFDAISGMSKSTLVAIPPVTKSPSVTLDEAAFNLLGSGATFPDDTKDTTLTYSHNGIDSDGSLTVTVTIAKGSGTTQTAEFTVAVSGINAATQANKDIAAVKGAFDAISGMSKSTLVAIPPVTKSPSVTLGEAAFNLLGSGATFPDDTKDTTLTYSHNGIDSDGSLTVTVTIAKGSGTTQTAEFTVAVSGINAATQANKDIAAVKGAFDAISGMSKSTLVAIPPVTKSPSVTLDEATFNLLGSGATFPDDTKDTTLTYSHNGIDSDGSLTVTVTIAKGSGTTQTAEFTVAVSGINAATQANKDIAAVKGAFDAISGMSKSTLVAIPPVTKSPSVTLGEAAFNLLGSGATFPDDTKDTTLTYSHNGIDSDGSLTVTVTIAKGSGTTQTAEFTVAVSGIDDADIAAVKGAFDAISGMSKSTLVAIPPVTKSPSVTLGEAAFNLLGSGATFPDDTKDTTLTYSHNGIDSDGLLTVTVTIAKGSGTEATATFDVAVRGINDADIAFVKEIIEAISVSKDTPSAILKVVEGTRFDAAALSSLGNGGTFPDEIRSTTLTYSHEGINRDGPLAVIVTIAKGSGETKTATFDVVVSGIDVAQDNKDIAAVKRELEKNIRMSKITTTAIEPVSKESGATFDEGIFKLLVDGGTFPDEIRNTTLTYSHKGINRDGLLIVYVRINKGSGVEATSVFLTQISGINAQANKDIAAVKEAIEGITMTKTISATIQPVTKESGATFNAAALSSLGIGGAFPDEIRSTTLTYSHEGIDNEGPLSVTVTIAKGSGETKTAIFTIDVSETDEKAVRDVEFAIKNAKFIYNANPLISFGGYTGIYTNEKFGANINQKNTKISYIYYFKPDNLDVLDMVFKVVKGTKKVFFNKFKNDKDESKNIFMNDDWKNIREIIKIITNSANKIVVENSKTKIDGFSEVFSSGEFDIVIIDKKNTEIRYQHDAFNVEDHSASVTFRVSKNGKSLDINKVFTWE